jgi:hypothetical protein
MHHLMWKSEQHRSESLTILAGHSVALALHVLRAMSLIAGRAGRLLLIAINMTACGGVRGLFHATPLDRHLDGSRFRIAADPGHVFR